MGPFLRVKHGVTYVNTGYELHICESMAKYGRNIHAVKYI